MATTNPAAKSAARFLSARVVAVRAELSDLEQTAKTPGQKAMVKALKVDLLQLECRLADATVTA
jgi:hypothetical protein